MKDVKTEELKLIDDQCKLLKDLGLNDWTERLSNSRKCLMNKSFTVLFVGEFNRGKSTLFNAFLGENILAVSAVPIPTVNQISHSGRTTAMAYSKGHPPQSVPLSALPDKEYDQVEVGYPISWLPSGVVLKEQPTMSESPEAFQAAISTADFVVVVLASDALYSSIERQCVEQIKAAGHREIFFVCNFCDRIPSAELTKVRQAAHVRLPANPDRIFFLSAELAATGNPRATAELNTFRQELLAAIQSNPAHLKRERTGRLLQQSIDIAAGQIATQQAAESEARVSAQEHQDTLRNTYDNAVRLGHRLEEDLDDFRQRTNEVIQAMTATFIRDLAQQIAQWVGENGDRLKPSHIEAEIRGSTSHWQRTELEPYLKAQLSQQLATLKAHSQAFNTEIDRLYSTVGSVPPQQSPMADLPNHLRLDEIELERSRIPLGKLGDSRSGDSPLDLLQTPQVIVALAAAVVSFLIIQPPVLGVPTGLVSLGAAAYFTFNQKHSRQQSTRQQLAQAYGQSIRRQADPVSIQVMKGVNAQLEQLQKTVRSYLNHSLLPIREHIQPPAADTKSPQSDAQRRLEAIEQAFQKCFGG